MNTVFLNENALTPIRGLILSKKLYPLGILSEKPRREVSGRSSNGVKTA